MEVEEEEEKEQEDTQQEQVGATGRTSEEEQKKREARRRGSQERRDGARSGNTNTMALVEIVGRRAPRGRRHLNKAGICLFGGARR